MECVFRELLAEGVLRSSPRDLAFLGIVTSASIRSFRSEIFLLDAIDDLSTAQKLAGHSDPGTTALYDRRGERAMREAASHLHVPHVDE